jgi:non-heme chloroperoxidase
MTREVSTVTLEDGLTLSYAEQGDRSGPALVLLPGPTDSWWSYPPVLEGIPLTIRTIAVSQRGHGDSDKPTTGYRVEDFAADVVPFLDALGIEGAALAGHSGSCLVARRAAIDLPGRVAGLVLEASPTTLHGDAHLEQFVESIVSGLEDPIDPGFVRSFAIDTSSGEVRPEVLDHQVGELLKVPARVWRETFTGLLHYDDLAELARITAPILLIWGDADELVGREMQEQLARRLSSADLVVYPGVGHTPRWEDPARFASDVSTFVERVGLTPSGS